MACKSLVLFVFLFLCVMLASQSASHGESDDLMMNRFEEWMAQYGRVYNDEDEKLRRFEIFKENVNHIETFNDRKGNSYTLGINQFTDITYDEFVARYTGASVPPDIIDFEPSMSFEDVNVSSVPQSIDWRDHGAVTKVKHQGTCGSCWAFAAVAAVEGIYKIKKGKLILLSEQEVLDCTFSRQCVYGFVNRAFEFIVSNKGVASEADYPYVGYKDTCAATSKSNAAYITGYNRVKPAADERQMMLAVSKQPIVVMIDVHSEFQKYQTGIYRGPCGNRAFHFITIIGYGEDKTGLKYWIIKNSWGETWGENGFGRIERDSASRSGVCGIASYSYFPTLDSNITAEHSDVHFDGISSM